MYCVSVRGAVKYHNETMWPTSIKWKWKWNQTKRSDNFISRFAVDNTTCSLRLVQFWISLSSQTFSSRLSTIQGAPLERSLFRTRPHVDRDAGWSPRRYGDQVNGVKPGRGSVFNSSPEDHEVPFPLLLFIHLLSLIANTTHSSHSTTSAATDDLYLWSLPQRQKYSN